MAWSRYVSLRIYVFPWSESILGRKSGARGALTRRLEGRMRRRVAVRMR
jgi:hypothetical protein